MVKYKKVLDLLCECKKCHDVHVRSKRKRVKGKGRFLFKYVCPKCGCGSYMVIGDEAIGVKIKDDDLG